jgi:acyl-CoA reductase-like NAD-dependent aldehyde dehydrogenase
VTVASQPRSVRVAGRALCTARTVAIHNPYGGALVAEVPLCGPLEVDTACRAAEAALARADFPQHQRAAVLARAAALVEQRLEQLAETIALESAKPIRAARAEVERCIDTLTFAAAEARTFTGEMIPLEASRAGAGRIGFALRVPIGVIAAITPFNFPLNLVAHKLAPAIAAGCPVVLKPAPQAPLSAIALVELLVEAGLPGDWISVLTDGGREAGEPLVAHAVPAMVTFTGSVGVGHAIAAAAPRKRVALELGSNAPLIVEPDADLADVVARVRTAGYGYAGQSCISVQRLLVHRSREPELLERLHTEVESLVLGDPLEERTELGPLISPRETERVRSWIEEAVGAGGRLITGGRVRDDGILTPAVVAEPPRDAALWRYEAFGPVVVTAAYDDFEQALALANDTELPLQAAVFTRDLGRALDAVRRLRFGGVLVNEVPTFRADQQPYGGRADAGNTREGPRYAIAEMTELRTVIIRA